MLFSSPVFFLFFGVYFLLHALLPKRYRIYTIIVGSTVFYAYWYPFYTWVPFMQILIAYGGAMWVDAGTNGSRTIRTGCVTLALLVPLFFFKYTNFVFGEVYAAMGQAYVPYFDLPLPLGISFITFTMLSYVVDVHRRDYPAVASLLSLTGYTLYFPQLIAGPILRPHQLIPQIDAPRDWREGRFLIGVVVFTVGLLKKLVIADPIATAIDPVFAGNGTFSNLEYIVAIYGFSVQIYCDFSGYSDMAIGLGLVLGVRLPLNFRQPYLASNIREFWSHWHITLSNWLRDYLYIPLGGSRRGRGRAAVNVLITMALGGLWHGASWNFLIWGCLHGLAIMATQMFGFGRRRQAALRRAFTWRRVLAILITFHFVTLAWIPFRAADLATSWRILSGPFNGIGADMTAFVASYGFAVFLIVAFLAAHPFDKLSRVWIAAERTPKVVLWAAIALAWVLAIAVSTGSSNQFIYFDF